MSQSFDPSRSAGDIRLSRRTALKGAAALGGATVFSSLGLTKLTTGKAGAQDANYLIYASSVDIPNIDPAVGNDEAIATTQKSVYDTLYRHTQNPPQLVPWLATNSTVSDDGLTYTFTLDSNAKFQDGSPLTADAVIYSFERLLSVGQGVAYMFQGVVDSGNVTKTDDHTVVFKLNAPFAPFLHTLTWLFILNPTVVKANESNGDQGQAWLTSNAAGSGPFKINTWDPGNQYVFDADPNYWKGWADGHIDGYIHSISTQSSTKRLALQNGDVQFGDYVSPQDLTLLQKVDGVVVPTDPGMSVFSIKMNNAYGPTSDVNVRRAISYAMDYDAVIKVMSGFATRVASPLSSAITGAVTTPKYNYDIDQAKAELAKSTQYAGGFDLDFFYVNGLDEERQTGEILADSLKQLNINLNVQSIEWANAVAKFADASTSPSLFPIYSGTNYPDPDYFLYAAFHSSSAGTWEGADQFKDDQIDKWLVQARQTTDEATRTDLYTKIQNQLIDNAVEVFLFTSDSGVPHSAAVQGYDTCPVMGSSPFWYGISIAAS